jgi:hypothetical protein
MGDVGAAHFSFPFPRLRQLVVNSSEWFGDVVRPGPAAAAAAAKTGAPVGHASALRSTLLALAAGLRHAPLTRLELHVGARHPDGVLPCLAALSTLQSLVVEFEAARRRYSGAASAEAAV